MKGEETILDAPLCRQGGLLISFLESKLPLKNSTEYDNLAGFLVNSPNIWLDTAVKGDYVKESLKDKRRRDEA